MQRHRFLILPLGPYFLCNAKYYTVDLETVEFEVINLVGFGHLHVVYQINLTVLHMLLKKDQWYKK